ncbi:MULTISPECIES: phosphoribosyl-ATP diphosphatase [Inquilinus]|jgi:phosphoribosyl-ATP pyrophosphohydrolase|uniref:phosphoribosyl-ATP diphosphatase n=1 Tax=Inquilinus ginsengisoli TaxID=363840 RepID=A0ABU1JQL4_9PROT|nr:phosphoribosyl-ATP diphosphatase [Inquilinus ginsengisoli]MDR6289819.1 phosphoribosyl-ATP pyrophosphohydrolase [Inquilinus ginsengisoli]
MGQSLGRDRLEALAGALRERRSRMEFSSRTARLIDSGVPKMAQKLVEEAAEVAIDAVQGERQRVVEESADLMFNLTVLLTEMEISPAEVWEEMDRRQKLYGLAEKLPKDK